MKLVFFNATSIGDMCFSRPFLQAICKSNPLITFYYYTNYGSFIFSDIPNLKLITEKPKEVYKNIFESVSTSLLFFDEEKNLYINTWCAALNSILLSENCECSVEHLNKAFKTLFSMLSTNTEVLPIVFPDMSPFNQIVLFPTTKKISTEQYLNTTTVFYLNRLGYSASTKPFTSNNDHICILERLSSLFPDILFIIPSLDAAIQRKNVIPTKSFGIIEDETCENVFQEMKLALSCTFFVTFDIGSGLLYANQDYFDSSTTILHMSHTSRYHDLNKKNIEYSLGKTPENLHYIQAFTPLDVVKNISSQLAVHSKIA